MCGIAGLFGYRLDAEPVRQHELRAIRDAMANRGPDGAGSWSSPDGRLALAHRRLAIIDLSEHGSQPMASADARFTITFNGEIYNHRELRGELLAAGHRFASDSDTEVLLHLYASRGAAMVHALRGMYAFAIWDAHERSLFLARDPFGIKPIYYADDGSTFRFASQVKALLAGDAVSREPSAAGHVGFYLWGHVPDPHTPYAAISALPAGSTLRVDARGRGEPQAFFDIAAEFASAEPVRNDDPTALAAALEDSVRHHMVADVPVGVFLSAGIDSGLLTALAARTQGDGLHTLTLAFDEYKGTAQDEAPLAEQVARQYGTRHETARISRRDFEGELERLIQAMDQPTIDGVNTYFVSRAAAAAGMKVALSGLGADEIFGGYPSFRDVPRLRRTARSLAWLPGFGSGFRQVAAPLLRRFTSSKYAGLFEYGASDAGAYLLRRGLYMPWELPELMDADLVREGWRALQPLLRIEQSVRGTPSDFARVSALELGWYMRHQLLRDADWAGMAHSLEIRVPYVDLPLFRHIARSMAKTPLSKLDAAAAAQPPLPAAVLQRPKTGFTVPVREWMLRIAPPRRNERGLRSWARHVGPASPRRISALVLATDAFGGRGGIAKFNRDFLTAMCSHPRCEQVVAIPRLAPDAIGRVPERLDYRQVALAGKFRYAAEVLRTALRSRSLQLVICGHINLLPLAWIASRLARAPLILVIHGIDAWKPTRSRLVNALARRVTEFVAVSEMTRSLFIAWTGLPESFGQVLPNSIDLSTFHPAPRNPALLERHGIEGKIVIMSMGRLSSTERYKGVDEMIHLLPRLLEREPRLAYVVVGDGDDRERLSSKAEAMGIADRVVFTGYVDESLKRDYLNLAHAFVMPGRGEGFGIVYLEALACGVPTVGSTLDGSAEALRHGELGILVNPDDPADLERGVLAALARPRLVEPGLAYFEFQQFEHRVHRLIDRWTTC